MTAALRRYRIALVIGTRPEAIKMAPLVLAMRDHPSLEPFLLVTAQHRQLLDSVLGTFELRPDVDLDLMRPNQSLPELSARILTAVGAALARVRPDAVLVHGDTTTCLCTTLAAFYERIPVGHVEAGLRSGDLMAPWPEEMNRRLVDPICRWCFAPTERARAALLAETVPAERIFVTGNTVIDALFWMRQRLPERMEIAGLATGELEGRRLVLVTGHRRESFGEGLRQMCRALKQIADRYPDVIIVYPVHYNPNVRSPVNELLGNHPRIRLIEPVDYPAFVYLMQRSALIITDSGGVQEEAPSLGKPVLVTRYTTERPEALQQGVAKLVGTDPEQIVPAAEEILSPAAGGAATVPIDNPFGDGRAAQRILQILAESLAIGS
jgi:UDP-N-acetylglucosamine 2-epimerase (non-hydrolysing)